MSCLWDFEHNKDHLYQIGYAKYQFLDQTNMGKEVSHEEIGQKSTNIWPFPVSVVWWRPSWTPS